MERIEHLRVHEFLEKLAEPGFPGPAGGSAAATAAAMAAALLEMSCKVTMKKSGGTLPIDLNEIEGIRRQCLALANDDMEALSELVRAGKSRKEFPERYEDALKSATDTLVSILKNSEFILRQIEQLLPVCDVRAAPDLIGGAYMAEASLSSAKLGAEANLHLLQDEIYKENAQKCLIECYKNGIGTKERIINPIKKQG